MHPLGSIRPVKSRGTVSLVALCFVAVLGISLASYIAVCSRAMQLSNRSFQAGVSQQLAEAGIEEALRAFNQNNWDDWTSGGISVDWTLDTTNKRATATMTFPTGKFGQGTTASIKLRVDNYDANVVGVSWSNSKSYRTGNLVGRNGLWYRCVVSNSGRTPSTNTTGSGSTSTFWIEEQMPLAVPWNSIRTYPDEAVVYHNGDWYRSKTSNTNQQPPANTSNSYWQRIPVITTTVSTASSNNESILNYWNGSSWTWWRYNSGWDSTPDIFWRWRSSYSYVPDDVVSYNGVWYRCTAATSSSIAPDSNPSSWSSSPSNAMWAWSSSLSYNLGDVVYHSGTSAWYRCTRANSGQTPSSASVYWANTPLFSSEWDSNRQYSQNDTVRYNGVWYLSLQNSNVAQNPETATSAWIGATTTNTSYTWSASTSYSVNAYRCYGGVWYRCIAATTANAGHTPNNTTYWTAAWSNSWGITTGAPVVYAEATVTLTGNPSQRTQLRATLAPAPLFPNAAGATGDLTITTGTGSVDSYDSQLGAYTSGTAGYSAVIAAGGTLAINGTTAVKGYLAWPFGSAPSGISTSTTVKGASSPISPNLDTARLSRSPYIPQFDILPRGGLQTAFSNNNFPKGTLLSSNPSGAVNIGIPGATTPSRYYFDGTLEIGASGSYPMARLNINGPVILYVNGYLRMEGGGMIDIASNSSAEIHLSSLFRAYSGSHGIRNQTKDPGKLILITDSTLSASTFMAYGSSATNTDFYGVFYGPSMSSSTGMEIRTGINIYGALSAKNITFSSEANLHYDSSLRHASFGGVDQPWAVSAWRELSITERATMP